MIQAFRRCILYSLLLIILSGCSLKASLSNLVSQTKGEVVSTPSPTPVELDFSIQFSNTTVTSATVDQNVVSFLTVTLNQVRTVDTVFNLSESSPDGATIADYDLASSTVTVLAGQKTGSIGLLIKGKSGSKDFDKRVDVQLHTVDAEFSVQSRSRQFLITDSNALVLTVNPMYPVNGANWNDYINGFSSVMHSHVSPYLKIKPENFPSDGVCVSNCLHGGELRKVIVSSKTQCANLSLVDSVNAFEWRCSEHVIPVYFYSVGFNKGKGLRDLLLPDGTDFKQLTVTLSESANSLGTSIATKWWSNPVEAISAAQMNSGGADIVKDLSTEGKIFVLTQAASTRGLNLLNNKMSFVTLPGITLSSTATLANTALLRANHEMIWIEANINNIHSNAIVLNFTNSSYKRQIRVHQTNASGAANSIGVSSDYVKDIVVTNSHFATFDYGLYLDTNTLNAFFIDSTVRNTNSTGLFSRASSSIIYKSKFLKGTAWGVNMGSADQHTVSESVFSNYAMAGYFSFAGSNNFVNNSLFAGNRIGLVSATLHSSSLSVISNSTYGLSTQMARTINSILINNDIGLSCENFSTYDSEAYSILVADNISADIHFANSSRNYNFYDSLYLGSGANKCTFGTGLINIGLATSDCMPTGSSTAQRTAGVNTSLLLNGFSNDTVNVHGASGTTGLAFTSLTDFFNFENIFRLWSKFDSVLTYPNVNLSGTCTAGNCGIFDYGLKANASYLKNENGSFIANQSCPSSIQGSDHFNYFDSGVPNKKALKFALEYLLDGFGNDNGLCEANENCYFNPHMGAYLVNPEKFTQTCTYDSDGDADLVGITIFGQ